MTGAGYLARMIRLSILLLSGLLLACDGPRSTGPVAATLELTPTEAALDAAGFDLPAMRRLTRELEAGAYTNAHMLLVAHDGRLVYERYLAGDDESWGKYRNGTEKPSSNCISRRYAMASPCRALWLTI